MVFRETNKGKCSIPELALVETCPHLASKVEEEGKTIRVQRMAGKEAVPLADRCIESQGGT